MSPGYDFYQTRLVEAVKYAPRNETAIHGVSPMKEQQEKVIKLLDDLGVEYQLIHHQAVFTVEEMEKLNLGAYGDGCKNLFLRDAKGRRHFLLVMLQHKQADLKSVREQLGCSRLGFASAGCLQHYLHLSQGEVTPMGIINDQDAHVEVVLDGELTAKDRLGFHPNDNTATVWIAFDDLLKIINRNGNIIHYVNL